MCLQPGLLSDGTEIACRKCWQCQERKIDDWVGRCIAENKTAIAAHSITLTYGRDELGEEDHFRAAWLTYSDVQKFFKRLRKAKYKFRYLVCGEYGSEKGRAHWHLIIFWLNRVPEHELTTSRWIPKRFNNRYWPHGYQHWEKAHAKNIRYVCKYIQKDIGKDEKQGHLSMSKKPPIGYDYFNNLAQKYVDAGLAPQDLKYRFPDVRKQDGSPKEFHMTGTTARNFIDAYKALWKQQYGGHHPVSVMIDEFDDKQARDTYEPIRETYQPKLRPVYGGSDPLRGRDPLTGKMGFFSDDENNRWWYRENGDEYSWQKEIKVQKVEHDKTYLVLQQAIQRDRAQRVQNGR